MPFSLNYSYEDKAQNGDLFCLGEMKPTTVWLNQLASEWVALRTEITATISKSIQITDIDIVDTVELANLIRNYTVVPPRTTRKDGRPNQLDTIRSDFGELVGYMVLESNFGTLIPWKPISQREIAEKTARGIDVVGIENGSSGKLRLVLAEVKASDEQNAVPSVVDKNDDSLNKTLLGHIKNRVNTTAKLFDIARKVANSEHSRLLFKAILLWEKEKWTDLDVVCCALLVRQKQLFDVQNFGALHKSCDGLRPACVRFLIVALPGSIDEITNSFHKRCEELVS